MRAPARPVVIAFPQARVRQAVGQARGPAEILIFPGVRIERLGNAPAPRPKARTPSRRKSAR
jgi:hypothetical protein